jgi:hypothetical protein
MPQTNLGSYVFFVFADFLGIVSEKCRYHALSTRRLGQVNAAGRPYAAPVKAEGPADLPKF